MRSSAALEDLRYISRNARRGRQHEKWIAALDRGYGPRYHFDRDFGDPDLQNCLVLLKNTGGTQKRGNTTKQNKHYFFCFGGNFCLLFLIK